MYCGELRRGNLHVKKVKSPRAESYYFMLVGIFSFKALVCRYSGKENNYAQTYFLSSGKR